MAATDSLQPCPFCGGAAEMFEYSPVAYAGCQATACEVRPVAAARNVRDACRKWNTRAQPTEGGGK